MTAIEKGPEEGGASVERKRRSLSWATMLILVFMAILLAAGFAFLLVNPFFHQKAP